MQGILHSTAVRPVPLMPTTYPPGSAGKECVMCSRLADRTQLHHPADARYEGDTLPLEWVHWWKEKKRQADSEATQKIFDKIKARKALGILANGEKVPQSSVAGG